MVTGGRPEPDLPPDALPPQGSHHSTLTLMRILDPIVLSQALLMVAGEPKMLEGGGVGTQLVSRHPVRREALLAEQLAHELDGCALVPSALKQDFEDLAFMIDRNNGHRRDGAFVAGDRHEPRLPR
jgi:hypothetical protein